MSRVIIWRMVFDWHEEEADALKEVDAAEGGDAEVEEDAEDDRVRD